MSVQKFEGESRNGNFQEALANAIRIAKEKIPTDFVEWEIDKIYGEDGGFITVQILKVVINAKAHSESGKS